MNGLDDAHNHLQDVRLETLRPDFAHIAGEIPLRRAVVNGTRESDWNQVLHLADLHAWILPSLGLHPWQVSDRSSHWLSALESRLVRNPGAAIGEIGLDRWITDPDVDAQVECFTAQLDLADRLDRPVTIHCLKAWGLLEETLRSRPRLPRGFLLHSYSGSRQMIPRWVELGAYFSISPYFAHERKADQRARFRDIPLDRILIETDAPDMRPPTEANDHPLHGPDGEPINHPANLAVSLHLAEATCGVTRDQLSRNFEALFGPA
jgi:TatD DNase family protein